MFVKNEAAIKVGKYLAVADMHIGLTKDLWKSGISLPSQVKSLADRLNILRKLTKTETLIIVGDLKHNIVGLSLQEKREVPEFLRLLKFKRIIIVKGNHDGFIEKLTSGIKNVSVKKSFPVSGYVFTHGHRNVPIERGVVHNNKKIIVIGHNHLCVRFRDDVGAIYTEPVWVRGKAKGKTIIIMPAFNELCGYYSVNKGKFNGPIASKLSSSCHVYLLDGTDIGRVKDLKLKE